MPAGCGCEIALRDLRESHDQLAAYAGQAAELSAAAERNRLARDIHDSLGHYLTAIAVQLEKAEVFRDRDQGTASQAVADARTLARQALQGRARVGPRTAAISRPPRCRPCSPGSCGRPTRESRRSA